MSKRDTQAVTNAVVDLLDEPGKWVSVTGYPNSLAQCVIDSPYSLRANYGGVTRVLSRYNKAREAGGYDPTIDSVADLMDAVADLMDAIDAAGGPDSAATELFGNQSKAPGTNRLKSRAVYEGAAALREVGVLTTEDLRVAANDQIRLAEVSKKWRGVKGLGPASWSYLLMLAGVDGTKPDIMVRKFVATAVGEKRSVSPPRARAAIEAVAGELGVRIMDLDHAVWRYQSGRWAGGEKVLVE